MTQTDRPYGDPSIEKYICRRCGLRWHSVERYDTHRREDHG